MKARTGILEVTPEEQAGVEAALEAPSRKVQVVGNKLLVRLTRPPERTPGGIWLPDGARRNLSQGVVIAAGNRIDVWTAVWCEEGAPILAKDHSFHPVTKETAWVYADDLLALVMVDEEDGSVLLPANDFCLISRSETRGATEGGVILPVGARRGSRDGIILDAGPGKLRPNSGDRRACRDIMNLPEEIEMGGLHVFWGSGADLVECSNGKGSSSLVAAGDLECFESL